MFNTRLFLFSIVLLSMVASATAQAADWVPYNEMFDGFSFKMPGTPQKSLNEKVTEYIFTEAPKTQKAIVYGVAVRKVQEILVDAEKLANQNLEDFANSVSDTPGATKIVSRIKRAYTVTTVEKNTLKPSLKTTEVMTGVEGRVQRQDGAHGIVVAFVDKNRHREFAMCYFVARDANFSEEDARRFFDSFTLLF